MSMTDDCTDNDLYLKAVTTMYNTNPTAQSAYYLYRLYASRDNVELASKYIEEAVSSPDLETAQAAEYNMQYATFCVKNGLSAKGFEAAQKALELDPNNAGKAYYLIGTIWASTSCGGDEISRRSPYWVACDYMNKAKAADPSLTEEANRYIGQYSRYFPQAAEAFMYDVTNGQSYTVACGGMRATTTVRTTK
jgi:tetratricopeptide (TPR) repeat protein